MKTIKFKLWEDYGRTYIRIDINTDPDMDLVLSSFGLLTWNKTLNCYLMPRTWANQNRLFEYLVSEGWYVDYSDLKSPSQHDIPPPSTPVEGQKEVIKKSGEMEDFMKWMQQKRYSKNTIKTYIGLLRVFFDFYKDKEATEISHKDIERFNEEYILGQGYSRVFQNQLISALKLYYMRYHNRQLNIMDLERPRRARKLPEVLSKDEVVELLTVIRNQKHKFLLSLIYSCGLRIGEALNLLLTDLDATRKLMHVRHAKGAKDRYIPLSDRTLEKLREYTRTYRPQKFVFEGRSGQSYTQSSARQVLQRALAQTNIRKRVTLHTLRHSYATHLLENGTDLRYIQELLGHANPKTTMLYTHVSTSGLQKIRNPFDDLDL